MSIDKGEYGRKECIKLFSRYESIEEIKKDIVLHGTCEDINGSLRGGGFDNVLWSARTADVAQTYIPSSGATTMYVKPLEWDMDKKIDMYYEDSLDIQIARMLGYEIETETDDFNKIISYSVKKNGEYADTPTNKEIYEYLTNDLGYSKESNALQIKMSLIDGKSKYVHNNFKEKGKLFILSGVKELKLFDISTGESDLMVSQYYELDKFKKLAANGYDGVIIDDHAQSDRWGNVGHESVGLFPSGIEKVKMLSIPVVSFDWGEHFCPNGETPEFPLRELFEESRDLHNQNIVAEMKAYNKSQREKEGLKNSDEVMLKI